MESKSFQKAIKFINEDIARYDEAIQSEKWQLSALESARNDRIKIRDSLDPKKWHKFLGEYGIIEYNKYFSSDDEE